LITDFSIVDNWSLQATISPVKKDKHSGAVIALEMARQFAHRREKHQ
jgi:hypothetical protein